MDSTPARVEAGPVTRLADHPASSVVPGTGPTGRLFYRLMVGNGLVFALAATALVLSPATVSAPVRLAEVAVVGIGLALLLVVNAAITRLSLRPLDSLTALMERVDLLRPGDRLPVRGAGDVSAVLRAFNEMLDRLERERATSSARALEAQEGERRRIARELHDEIGQSLTAVLLGLKRTVDRGPEHLRDELHVVQEGIRTALDEVRQVARRLRPGVLEDLGLVSALNALAAEFCANGVPVRPTLSPPPVPLGPDAELVVYRIAQESLTNVGRHARAGTVELSLHAEGDRVVLGVVDDGCGVGAAGEGAGIQGMRERALLVGGRLSIGAGPQGGTEVRLTIPIRRR